MDWNNDGNHDLLVGDSIGRIRICLKTARDTDTILDCDIYVTSKGKPLNAGERVSPTVDDWNNDGKKDIIAGILDGRIKIYLNKGTDRSPAFGTFSVLKVGGKDFRAGSRAAPRVFDWDGDGLKDILVGEMEGYVYYLQNVGKRDAPLFRKSRKFLLGNGEFLRYPGSSGYPRSRIYITDWNNDGLSDILIGGEDGRVILHLASPETPMPLTVLFRRVWNQSREKINREITLAREIAQRLKKRLF